MLSPDHAPKVSVVVLTWNRRQLLGVTLDSVLGQTERDIEVLVVDNESTDGTQEFVESLAAADTRIRYIRHANGGVISVNRNLAISQSRGEWIGFCDDDDIWEPDKLEKQLAEAAQHPEAGLVSTNAVYFSVADDGSETVYGTLVDRADNAEITFDDLVNSQRTQVVMSSVIYTREVADDVGPWVTDPEIFTVEDLQYWMRAVVRGHRIRYLAEPLVRFRVHPATASSAPDTRVGIRKLIYAAEELHAQGIFDDSHYRAAVHGFRRRLRVATLKEYAKRIPGLKGAVYERRARSASGRGSSQ